MKNRQLSHYAEIQAFITRDGSVIRELMHPASHGADKQSLAEARLAAGQKTLLHRHQQTEEIYYITQGRGLMTLGKQQFEVLQGDTICIPPGAVHCLENLIDEELVLLCCCSPAYSHEDTEIIDIPD